MGPGVERHNSSVDGLDATSGVQKGVESKPIGGIGYEPEMRTTKSPTVSPLGSVTLRNVASEVLRESPCESSTYHTAIA